MKTCFISRLGGGGDVLHASHLPRLIKEHYGVDYIHFETNYHGMHILTNNPYIDKLEMLDITKVTVNRMTKNLQYAEEKYDLVFNLVNTIEKAYCTNENDWRYYKPNKWRRKHLGTKSYYDVMVDACGLPEKYYGERGQLYFFDDEHAKAREWVAKKKLEFGSDYLVIVNLSGTSMHKRFEQAKEFTEKFLDKYPTGLIVLTGDANCQNQVFEHERVINKVQYLDQNKEIAKGWNFRTAALFTKYVDLTISLETGLALIAHSWDAPCVQLLTAASFDNHVKYAKNAYWLQAPVACSPCHRNPREYFGCPTIDKLPACVFFDLNLVMEKVEEALSVSSCQVA